MAARTDGFRVNKARQRQVYPGPWIAQSSATPRTLLCASKHLAVTAAMKEADHRTVDSMAAELKDGTASTPKEIFGSPEYFCRQRDEARPQQEYQSSGLHERGLSPGKKSPRHERGGDPDPPETVPNVEWIANYPALVALVVPSDRWYRLYDTSTPAVNRTAFAPVAVIMAVAVVRVSHVLKGSAHLRRFLVTAAVSRAVCRHPRWCCPFCA